MSLILDKNQRYPGELTPHLEGLIRFPVPDKVACYTTREHFLSLPKDAAQWVHWKERAELVLEGKYMEVTPVHFEAILTLVCSFLCPHCARREARTQWTTNPAWSHNSEIDGGNTMSLSDIKRILDRLTHLKLDDYLGIVWGGGDPAAYPWVYDAMEHAKGNGFSNSFITNGVLIDTDRILEIEPTLIRISLNCASPGTHARFHGYDSSKRFFEAVILNIERLVHKKVQIGASTLVGVSLIVDERNLEELNKAALLMESIGDGKSARIDYVIVRPVMNYSHFQEPRASLEPDTKAKAKRAVLGPDGPLSKLRTAGIAVVPIKDSFEDRPLVDRTRQPCLTCGWYGEIRHNGDVQFCSDSYGNPDYTIGNLLHEPFKAVWNNERRRDVATRIRESNCFNKVCPHNSRGHHLNRVFHQIENFRSQGRIDEVYEWCEALRKTTTPVGHSFFM